ncbi:MAG: choice-of-anchor Q domain-containing protein [Caldilineaceae bacterium]
MDATTAICAYSLLPAVDAGDDSAIDGVSKDLAGNARIQGGHVDMGAYEVAPAPLLGLSKVVEPATDVAEADVVTYTLTLENTGAAADSAVTVTDTAAHRRGV